MTEEQLGLVGRNALAKQSGGLERFGSLIPEEGGLEFPEQDLEQGQLLGFCSCKIIYPS